MKELLLKYGLGAGALVLAFAAGNYTMRASTKTELEREYEVKYTEKLSKLEASLKEEFRQTTESVRKISEENSTKLATIEEKITVKPDGTHVVERRKSTSEVKKAKSTSSQKSNTTQKLKDEKKTETKVDIAKQEKAKEVIKTTPPPSWRAYGMIAKADITRAPKTQYGAGGMYDFGPIGVGAFGTYQPDGAIVSIGLTAGVAF